MYAHTVRRYDLGKRSALLYRYANRRQAKGTITKELVRCTVPFAVDTAIPYRSESGVRCAYHYVTCHTV